MKLLIELCEEEVLAKKSKVSPLTISLMKDLLNSTMLPSRATDNQVVLCQPTGRCSSAAPVPVIATILDDKKTDNETLETLNEEGKQVTAHTNLTRHAPTNDCVRYRDIGQEKERREDSSEQRAPNDDKHRKEDLRKQASKQKAQARKNHSHFSTHFDKRYL